MIQSTNCGSGRRNHRGEVEYCRSFSGLCCGVFEYDKTPSLSWNGCSYRICRRARVYRRFQCFKCRPARVHICGRWGEWCRRPQYRAKRTTETGSREAQSVKLRSDSVSTLQCRCSGTVRIRVHPALGIWLTCYGRNRSLNIGFRRDNTARRAGRREMQNDKGKMGLK